MKYIKKHFSSIIIFLIFITGLTLLVYPTFSNWWNNTMASHSISDYQESVENIDRSEIDTIFNSAYEYNKNIAVNGNRYHPSEEEHKEYLNLLKIDDSILMGTIEIPQIKLNLPIFHGTSDEVLSSGAGHLEGSSLPVGGIGTHAVITGHRGLPSAKLFTDLDQLVEGDYVILRVLNQTLTYEIDQIRVVLPDQLEDLEIEPDKDLLTLVTCTPYGINSHRLLLTGHRVENLPEDFNGAAEAKLMDSKFVALFVAIPILIGLFIWLMVRYRKPKE